MFNEKNFETIQELDQKYKSAQKQIEIDHLQDEKEKEQAQKEAEQLENYVLWLVVGISLMVLTFVVIQFLIKKKNNEALAQKNQIIQASLAEKEVLMREIHHRVKNNFQMVSGILMIQANNSENPGVKQALLEVRNRVQSMAITHQKLYQSDSITNIQLKPFLISLIEEIEAGHGSDEVILSLDIHEATIPVEMAVNIGLIVTEGMINAYKYAFDMGGNLSITARVYSYFELEITDNGPGFAPDPSSKSFGIKMIQSLVQKNGGEVAWEIKNGTTLRVKLPI